ncbi:hypothetical protein CV102_14175 [Natronococcus pandeyae]|uniref:Uncharacterized protein n=1 Tax=Natronococcus pandeyae TaxID=2055836 RepID=A0A8J8Q5A9_9EURY|nr:hypothetical protein [Natronococcus pandeyae]TYL37874.1 hypothetical protein CV102_14175 [Natronococcus pandeyae]
MCEQYSSLETEPEFHTALQTVVTDAMKNSVSVTGSWDCRFPNGDLPDLEITIMEVEKPFPESVNGNE